MRCRGVREEFFWLDVLKLTPDGTNPQVELDPYPFKGNYSKYSTRFHTFDKDITIAMHVNLEDYNLRSKIFFGNNLIIIFQHKDDINDRRVLELDEVAGFIEHSGKEELASLRIVEDGSTYSFDLSHRLDRPEINNFPEVLIFIAGAGGRFCFRACAKNIRFREWTEHDVWLK